MRILLLSYLLYKHELEMYCSGSVLFKIKDHEELKLPFAVVSAMQSPIKTLE